MGETWDLLEIAKGGGKVGIEDCLGKGNVRRL